jgi:hypothetical protein
MKIGQVIRQLECVNEKNEEKSATDSASPQMNHTQSTNVKKKNVRVQVSLDGVESIHDANRGAGSCQTIIENIRMVMNAGNANVLFMDFSRLFIGLLSVLFAVFMPGMRVHGSCCGVNEPCRACWMSDCSHSLKGRASVAHLVYLCRVCEL